MNINLKNEYPGTPESFHSAVHNAVNTLGEKTEITARRKSPMKIIALAAVVIILLTVSAFGADTVYDYFVKKDNYKVTIDFNDEISGNAQSVEFVNLEFGYMPDYLDTSDAPYKFNVKTESGDVSSSGLTFQLFEAETAKDLEILYVGSVTECMFGENQGAVLKIETGIESDSDSYDRQFLIYFDDFGYILRCYVSGRINDDEMIKIAGNIRLVESDKENAFIVDTYIPAIENGGILEPSSDMIFSYSADAVVRKIGESFDIRAYNGDIDGNDYTISIRNVEIRNNVNGLDMSSFGPTAHLDSCVDENGFFKTYERKTYDYGDGENSVATLKKTETVGRKIILVDIDVTNNENCANEFYIDTSICSIKGTLESNMYNCFEASYISGQNGDSGSYYHIPFESGENKTITYGFIIDADADFADLMFIAGSLGDVKNGVVIE